MGELVSLFLCGAWDREYEVLLHFLRDGSRDGRAGEPASGRGMGRVSLEASSLLASLLACPGRGN